VAALATGLICCGLAAGWIQWHRAGRLEAVRRQISSIMGTGTQITAVVDEGQTALANRAIDAACDELRAVESKMSVWNGATELSALNRARAGEHVPLSDETLFVMGAALDLARATEGAFDPTCRPLLTLWKRAEERNREPDAEELTATLRAVGFRQIALSHSGATKQSDAVGIDLGGIAKGYAVDRAVDAMRKAGVRGGLVKCGGDLRVFGPSESGGPWQVGVAVPYPAAAQYLPPRLALTDIALSTSGETERYYTVNGRRHSHIVDPRTGVPVAAAPMVMVAGPRAMLTDGWSTALSVMGAAGLTTLPPGHEAMVLSRQPRETSVHRTPGFAALIASTPPPP
jgi:FAD:protein FMN transferase